VAGLRSPETESRRDLPSLSTLVERYSGCVELSEEVRLMDWPMGYDGADIQALAASAASTYWWPLLGWAAGALILLFLAVLVTSFPVRRRFWCEQAGRKVEVEFEEDGPPGHRRSIAVVSCTAFEPSTYVRCHRACLDRNVSSLEVRRQS